MVDSTDYRKWLIRARQDIRMAEMGLNDDVTFLADSICYACQQAAEKLLKAFLLRRSSSLMRSHDLRYLLRECIKLEPKFSEVEDVIKVLNEYVVDARYPGDFSTERTRQEALDAYEYAKKVCHLVLSYIEP